MDMINAILIDKEGKFFAEYKVKGTIPSIHIPVINGNSMMTEKPEAWDTYAIREFNYFIRYEHPEFFIYLEV